MEDTNKLTQIEIDNIIDESINILIISKLKELKIITEQEYFILREKIKTFY